MLYTSEVAIPLFSDGESEENRALGLDPALQQRSKKPQSDGHAPSVVCDARADPARPGTPDLYVGAGSEHGIEVRGDDDRSFSKLIAICGILGKNVSDIVEAGGDTDAAQLCCNELAARAFLERGGRRSRDLDLLVQYRIGLLVQPCTRFAILRRARRS